MNKNEIALLAPANGQVIALSKTSDPIFSKGTMGDGFGLTPTDNTVLAPVSGTISMIAETKHAIGITTKDGLEVLVHMGVDTVGLKGEPFDVVIKNGQEVKAGDQIATMNIEMIKAKDLDTTIMTLITNSSMKLDGLDVTEGKAEAGDTVARAYLKESKEDSSDKKLSYDELATFIIKNVGGKDNINNLIHCITRLRFYLKDESKANDDILKNQRGILDVMHAGGQYQVVIGNEVTNVYDAVMKQLPGLSDNPSPQTNNQDDGKNPVSRAFSNLIGFITGSMSPVIGVIAASGIIKGLLALLTLPQLGALLSVKSPVYVTVSAMADSAFFFLPVLVGFAAAKRLGSDPMIAAVIGGFLVYPQMITWGKSMTTMFSLGSWNFQFLNYSYSIFPMILAAWLAKECEQWLKKVLPSYLQMIFTPLITILVVSTITLVITGPIIQGAANGIAVFINWLVSASGWVGGLIIGAFYQLLVIFGLHWGVVPLVAQQIASTGQSSLNAIICATMVSQGAAVLAVAIKSKKADMKELGIAAAISAFCGVTEPAIYGINLRYKKVFASGCIGSAFGGLVTGLMHGTMYGFTGGLIGFSSFFNPAHPTPLNSFYTFLIASAVSIIVSFIAVWVWGYNDNMTMGKKVAKKQRPGSAK
ncbi:glucose PTS transporter subunit IIA [Lactobacillus crispatus]|jgi:PTS system, glucose subfamily, IIA component|uniref:PTS system sucrose-specific EIIBCA component n=1 Tax=Lactobacillus crispatus TaxID=47770 RepID=A0A135YZZ9_9LACO|nr:PTS glucose transporter subunit IIABC [Lactobacillus crispatus]STX17763.1 PTS system, trehalose-specific IIB component / PTS system, trehalose-specific IIC component/ PTS system, trehalose-specific IIA component [Lactobacillus acidophilus]EEJ69419.1 phosphotransferase system, EIIC [Lactobacillus crispatus JV-V01]EEU27835.1 PTS system, glucose subfamily, IIA component [Lactobacillus crispatus MV-1A-US]EEX29832.1 PTS system beta-glucoside-specific EIIBCA component family protein [Lactobacillus